jgi:hypothetical protein
MDADLGSWLFGTPLGAMGGMLGMAIAIVIVLAATTFGSALLYATSGFGFAVLAAPLFLLFLDPPRAIQLVIIISTVRAAARPRRLPLRQSDPGPGGRRSADPWLRHTDGSPATGQANPARASIGQPLG